MRIMLIVAGLGLLVVLVNAGCAAVRAGYDTAPYKMLRHEGRFEVRQYPDLMLVSTPLKGSDGSFMRLFRYIQGQNEARKKIAMTTPVFMERGASNGMMAFVLPATLQSGEAPVPTGPEVALRTLPGGRYAVLRFSGGMNESRERRQLARLRDWLAAAGLKTLEEPVFGYFDPPWTPPFMRRNEVMLRLVAD